MTKLSAIQMASGPNVSANLSEAARLIAMAADAGADLVVLPENFAIMEMAVEEKIAVCEADGKGPIQDFLSGQAAKHGVWLVGGTIPLQASVDNKIRSACLLFNDKGERVARYDKIHLFDVSLAEHNEEYNESVSTEPGDQVVVAETPFGNLGMAVCYDLRFPELFRQMMDQGADIIAIPSAFTAITGAAHWEVLVKARAIENLCFVIAAAQGGYHVNGRETYGNSMIVNPWGTVLDRLPSGSGFVIGNYDRNFLEATRRNFPALGHRRMLCSTAS